MDLKKTINYRSDQCVICHTPLQNYDITFLFVTKHHRNVYFCLDGKDFLHKHEIREKLKVSLSQQSLTDPIFFIKLLQITL